MTSNDQLLAWQSRTAWRPLRWILAVVITAVVVWSFSGTGIGLASLIEGRAGAAQLVSGLFPPDLDAELLSRVATAMAETVQISVAALVFGAVIGLPLAVVMAGNVQAPRWLSAIARGIATMLRSVHELLWALLFVATVGLGPAAGVYAISLHSAGVLAKLCSEQLEAVDPAPVETMRLTGGSRLTTALLAVIPQSRAHLASQVLYQWECNIRSSVVIGFVGAGGIGQALGVALHLFRYQELATLVASVVILVIGVDRISKIFRSRLGAASGRVTDTASRPLRSLLGRSTR
ncbi:phosphonate ABC transporter, permease protein PhnE [Planomonospora parontospora subsp. parontospora]|uniref:Phosphonate ABC transporter, permease protein PhnE n=2 Tax=Planomonospora parontospora TaxID=58119 RepID=A0AA37F5W4_9ACTN|nr:phosphonate ABC transporter, permease protein PhnE [Planomonospora parontospora]GGK76594.1 phosphonate ABC transporter, permease protein PhnE [Planomonospora parontospora]GII10113.1 phosphonate ABC transporter, permease protein PhnE [Planomonospora parontospora subsp. parontospora]